jgi:hypothetical protein
MHSRAVTNQRALYKPKEPLWITFSSYECEIQSITFVYSICILLWTVWMGVKSPKNKNKPPTNYDEHICQSAGRATDDCIQIACSPPYIFHIRQEYTASALHYLPTIPYVLYLLLLVCVCTRGSHIPITSKCVTPVIVHMPSTKPKIYTFTNNDFGCKTIQFSQHSSGSIAGKCTMVFSFLAKMCWSD